MKWKPIEDIDDFHGMKRISSIAFLLHKLFIKNGLELLDLMADLEDEHFCYYCKDTKFSCECDIGRAKFNGHNMMWDRD